MKRLKTICLNFLNFRVSLNVFAQNNKSKKIASFENFSKNAKRRFTRTSSYDLVCDGIGEMIVSIQ
jgi:hypothetical protein